MIQNTQPIKAVVFSFLSLAFLSVSAFSQGQDQVVLKNGKSHRGQIQKETVGKIVFKEKEGAAMEISIDEIDQVIYADMSSALSEARRALQENELKSAVRFGQRALSQIQNGNMRRLHLPSAYYYLGQAHFLMGDYEQSQQFLTKLFQEVPNSRIFYPAARTLIRSMVYEYVNSDNKGKKAAEQAYDNITGRLSNLQDQAGEFDAPAEVTEQLDLLGGLAREEFGRPRTAQNIYEELSRSDNESIEKQARVGYARCQVRINEIQSGLSRLEDLREDYDNDSFVEAAYQNAKGLMILKDWEEGEKENTSKLREALVHFLKVATVLFPEPGDPSIEHRQALKNAAKVYRLLANHSKKGQGYFWAQARKTYQELIDVFPSTPESIHAKKQLQKMQEKNGNNNE